MTQLSPEQFSRWREIITRTLGVFHQLCQDHGLRYYAIGGTAIGAVRHHGIIPWDDDIDVGMPRADYDRLLSLAPTALPQGYELILPETHRHYNLPFAKLCDARTTLVERPDVPCVIGLFIDIFPLDAAPSDRAEAERLVRRYRRLQNRLEAITTRSTFVTHLSLLAHPRQWGRFVIKTIGYFFRPQLRRHLLSSMNQIARAYNHLPAGLTTHLVNYGGAYGVREIFPASLLDGPPLFMPFEDIQISMMPGYDQYLRGIYGDYMQMPPEDRQTPHHLKHYVNLTKRENPF